MNGPTANCVTNVAVLGATGSIGRSTLDVIRTSKGRLRLIALSAHSRLKEAAALARECRPKWLVATSQAEAADFNWSSLVPDSTEVCLGEDAIERVIGESEVDCVVSAVVGSAGLRGTWAAAKAGKRLALANKESMVVAGPLVMREAKRMGATIIPVDSEHSAVFQAMSCGRREDVRRIVLTASGGPFRGWSLARMQDVTVADALQHPTWNMGTKITIDSATMMNKALEIVEARWLFGLEPDQIDVVVHPQSVVHSMVEFVDGSVVAQLGQPDMRLPIQYALTYPQRYECPVPRLDWSEAISFEFEPPDHDRFPALSLGYEVARSGGTAGAVVNAANETAVQRFLAGDLAFPEIVQICRSLLEQHHFEPEPNLEQLLKWDGWARQEVNKWIRA